MSQREHTEPELPLASPVLGRRGRLQRQVRRQREHSSRDAVLGAVISAALLFALHAGPWSAVTPAMAEQRAAATQDGADSDGVFRATMVGDVMFGRHVARAAELHGHDSLLAHVAPLLQGDYVSANLEQVVTSREDLPEAEKLIHLSSDARALDAMVGAGVTTVSLANNHSMDHGMPGLRDTLEAVDAAGLEHAGAGLDLDAAVEPNLQQHGDLTVATLSFTDAFVRGFIALPFQGGVLRAEPETFVPLIQRADLQADLVIVNFHWGNEYDIRVSGRQRELAEFASLAGADVIVGHHPHVLMPAERINDTLVLYSLGNFVFDQGWTRTRESAVASYTLGEDGTARVEFEPVYIREGTPRPLSGPLAGYHRARIFERLRGDSLTWEREGGRLVTEIDHRHVLEGDA